MKAGVLKLSLRTSTTWRSARPSNFAGSNSRNLPKSASSNFLYGVNCQSSGPSRAPSSVTPESRKALDRVAGFRQHAPVHRVARAFQRKDKVVRHLRRPFAEGRRRLRAVEGAVDLDRGQMLRPRKRVRARAAGPWDRTRRATARRSSRRCRCRCVPLPWTQAYRGRPLPRDPKSSRPGVAPGLAFVSGRSSALRNASSGRPGRSARRARQRRPACRSR